MQEVPQPGMQTSKSDLQILPHDLCANPSESPSLTASELHCRIAHCHLHHYHHHPKLSHDAPLPDLSTRCEPVANIKALGFSKYSILFWRWLIWRFLTREILLTVFSLGWKQNEQGEAFQTKPWWLCFMCLVQEIYGNKDENK